MQALNPFMAATTPRKVLSYRSPASGRALKVSIGRAEDDEIPISQRLDDIDAIRTRILERTSRFYIVIGTLLGSLMGMAFTLMVQRIAGIL